MTQIDNGHDGHGPPNPSKFAFCARMRRARPSYWERHRSPVEPDMNVISVLQRIAAQADTIDGREGRSGRLGLQLPGRSLRRVHDGDQRPRAAGLLGAGRSPAGRQSRRDRAAADEQVSGRSRSGRRSPPVVRVLKKLKAWIPVDGYYDVGPGPRHRRKQQEQLSAQRVHELRLLPGGLPAVSKIELGASTTARPTSNSPLRECEAYDRGFVGRATPSAR